MCHGKAIVLSLCLFSLFMFVDTAPGGVCAVIGCRDASTPLTLSSRERLVVHALFTDEAALKTARKKIRERGLYGRVSVATLTGESLPYGGHMVNMVFVEDFEIVKKKGLTLKEIFRVMAPLGRLTIITDKDLEKELKAAGFAGIEKTERMTRAVKPWPTNIDQWTHFCHGPDSNPVAHDKLVGPPKYYQWVADPLWLRAHDTDSSINSLVSSNGRIFYMVDEAPISLPGQHDLPDKWFVIGRDAFNGVELWKVPVKDWGWRAWKETWFKARPGVYPVSLNRRLTAVGDSVYVTLGYKAPVTKLDAESGKELFVYKGTERTNEIIRLKDHLVLSMNREQGVKIMCVDEKDGKVIWETKPSFKGTAKDYIKFKAMHGSTKPAKLDPAVNLSVDGKVVCLLDGRDMVCLDYKNGKEKWRAEVADEEGDVWMGSLIVSDGVVVCATARTLYGFSADSGKKLWTQKKTYLGHLWYEWKDVFVIDGLVWTYGPEMKAQKGKHRSRWPVAFNGYDLKTGKVAKTVPTGNIFTAHHHHRCYRNKATDRYILASRRGTEFVDLIEGKHTVHNWIRGTCHMGMMPANGLHYCPPHPCRCYGNEKLNGFNAIASDVPEYEKQVVESPSLVKGPAFEKHESTPAEANDWPTYRRDTIRSCSTKSKIPETLKPA